MLMKYHRKPPKGSPLLVGYTTPYTENRSPKQEGDVDELFTSGARIAGGIMNTAGKNQCQGGLSRAASRIATSHHFEGTITGSGVNQNAPPHENTT